MIEVDDDRRALDGTGRQCVGEFDDPVATHRLRADRQQFVRAGDLGHTQMNIGAGGVKVQRMAHAEFAQCSVGDASAGETHWIGTVTLRLQPPHVLVASRGCSGQVTKFSGGMATRQ